MTSNSRSGRDDSPLRQQGLQVRYSKFDKARWFHLGQVGDVPLSEARRRPAQIMFLVSAGADPHFERQAIRYSGTFGELAESYIKERGSRAWPSMRLS